MEEKLQWVFGLYDLDGDGLISKEEMLDVVGSIYEMLGRYTQPQILEPGTAAREHVDRIFHVRKLFLHYLFFLFFGSELDSVVPDKQTNSQFSDISSKDKSEDFLKKKNE